MAKVLYVIGTPKNLEASYSLKLAKAFLDKYKETNPSDEVTELNLYNSYIPLIDATVLSAWDKLQNGKELNDNEGKAVSRMSEILEQFIGADKVILSAPMWNFSFPPMVKAYIDNLVIAGKTFNYTEKGPVGLLKDKPVLLVQSRGGFYGQEPFKQFEDAESYLRNLFGFLGLRNFNTLLCEGVNFDPAQAENIFNASKEKAQELAKSF